jgi:hypothetical protein
VQSENAAQVSLRAPLPGAESVRRLEQHVSLGQAEGYLPLQHVIDVLLRSLRHLVDQMQADLRTVTVDHLGQSGGSGVINACGITRADGQFFHLTGPAVVRVGESGRQQQGQGHDCDGKSPLPPQPRPHPPHL